MTLRRAGSGTAPFDRQAVAAAVARARAGDRDAFGELVLQFENRIYAVALAAVRDADRAQELAQQAFVTAYERLAALQDNAAFPEWLRGIALNLARRRKRKDDLVGTLDGVEGGIADDHPFAPAWARLEHRERFEALHRELAQLPERYRLALTLRYFDDCSPGVIAEELGTTEGAAAMVLSRARRELATRLEARYPAEEW